MVCVDRRSLTIVNTISRGYFVEWFSGVGMVVGKVLLIVELVQQQQCTLTSLLSNSKSHFCHLFARCLQMTLHFECETILLQDRRLHSTHLYLYSFYFISVLKHSQDPNTSSHSCFTFVLSLKHSQKQQQQQQQQQHDLTCISCHRKGNGLPHCSIVCLGC